MDISADDLTNKNLYDYCHAEDLQKLRKAHIDCKWWHLEEHMQTITGFTCIFHKPTFHLLEKAVAFLLCKPLHYTIRYYKFLLSFLVKKHIFVVMQWNII